MAQPAPIQAPGGAIPQPLTAPGARDPRIILPPGEPAPDPFPPPDSPLPAPGGPVAPQPLPSPSPVDPQAPDDVRATAGDAVIFVSWSEAPAVLDGTQNIYVVKRAVGLSGAFTAIAQTIALLYSDRTVTNGITYRYRIATTNPISALQSPDSTVIAIATPMATVVEPPPPPPPVKLAAPAGFAVTAGNGILNCSWSPVGNATQYRVRYGTTSGVYTASAITAQTNVTLSGLTNGTTYFLVVSAIPGTAAFLESDPSAQVSATPLAPVSPPAAPFVGATGGNMQITLTWAAVPTATTYQIERSNPPCFVGPWTVLASSHTSTSYVDPGLTNGQERCYRVRACNAGGCSAYDHASAIPQSPAPLPPTSMVATPGPGTVSLSWTASTGASSYRVYEGPASSGPFTIIGQPTTTTFIHFTPAGPVHFYRVTAVNSGGESGPSNTVSAMASAPPPSSPPVTFSQTLINACYAEALYRGFYGNDGTRPTLDAITPSPRFDTEQCAAVTLAVIARVNPGASSGGVGISQRVANQIAWFLAGGSVPNSRDIPSQGIQGGNMGSAAGMILAIARHTPAIWNLLSTDTRNRADYYMRMNSVVGAVLTNNIDNTVTHNIQWKAGGGTNPNQRPHSSCLIMAALYFASAPGVDDGMANINSWLSTFSFANFRAQLAAFGWTNNLILYDQPQVGSPGQILDNGGSLGPGYFINSQGARRAFTQSRGRHSLVQGAQSHTNPTLNCPSFGDRNAPYLPGTAIGVWEAEFMDFGLNSNVVDQSCRVGGGGACPNQFGHLLTQSAIPSPLLGSLGAFLEYNFGSRSSPRYVAPGAFLAICAYATLCVLGYWLSTSTFNGWKIKFHNAMNDLKYKNQWGWLDTEYSCSGTTALLRLQEGNGIMLNLWEEMFENTAIDWANYLP